MVTYAQQTDPEKAKRSSIDTTQVIDDPNKAPDRVGQPGNKNAPTLSTEQPVGTTSMPITTPQSIKIDAPYSVDPKTGTAYNEDGTVYKKAEQTPTATTEQPAEQQTQQPQATTGSYYQDVYLPKMKASFAQKKEMQANEAFASKATGMRAEDISTGFLQGTVSTGELEALKTIDPNKYSLAKANIDKKRQLDAINNNQDEFLRKQEQMNAQYLQRREQLSKNDEGKQLVEKVFEDYGLKQSNENIKNFTTQINDINKQIDDLDNYRGTGDAMMDRATLMRNTRDLMKQRTEMIQARSAEVDYYNLGLEQADRIAKEYEDYNKQQIEMMGKQFELMTGMNQLEFEQKDNSMREALTEFEKDIVDAEADMQAEAKQKQESIFNTAVLSMYDNLPPETKALLVGLPSEQVATMLKTLDAKEKMSYDREFDMMKFDYGVQKDARDFAFEQMKFQTEQANQKNWDFMKGEDGNLIKYNEKSGEYEVMNTKYQPGVDISANIKPSGSKGGQCGFYTNRLIPGMNQAGGKWFGDSLQSKINMLDSTVPVVGGAFVMDIGTENGHVGVVTGINPDGTINITDSNWDGNETVRNTTLTKEQMKSIVGYMTPPKIQPTKEQVELMSVIKELESSPGKNTAVGYSRQKNLNAIPFVGGNDSPFIAGTDATAYEAKFKRLKDLLAFENIDKLKGAMSDKDIEFLRNMGTSLTLSMSEKEFDKTLMSLKKSIAGNTELSDLLGEQEEVQPIIPGGFDFSLAFPGADLLSTLND